MKRNDNIILKMIRKFLVFNIALFFLFNLSHAQGFVRTSDLFRRSDDNSRIGRLNITQDQAIDTLLSRYIFYNKNLKGMDGWRIQIYNSSSRNAREVSAKVRAEFISKFPGIASYSRFDAPGYYKIRVGDFRTKTEATKYLLIIRRVYPNAYLVPDIINFPDLNHK